MHAGERRVFGHIGASLFRALSRFASGDLRLAGWLLGGRAAPGQRTSRSFAPAYPVPKIAALRGLPGSRLGNCRRS
jgi:hypothetical protein